MAFWPKSANGVARMIRILIGLVAAIVIATGGFFGFEFYVQQRVAGEVEAAFDQIRATGSKARHGKESFDLSKHTITVPHNAGETAAQPPDERQDSQHHGF